MGCVNNKGAAAASPKQDPDPKPAGAAPEQAVAVTPPANNSAPPAAGAAAAPAAAGEDQAKAATKLQAAQRGKADRAAVAKAKESGDVAALREKVNSHPTSPGKNGKSAMNFGNKAHPQTFDARKDWTVDAGAKMGNAAWDWKAEQIDAFCKKVELDFGNTDPGSCKAADTLTGKDLCKEEGFEGLFGDGPEMDKVSAGMREVAISFMRDQCTCTEPMAPPSELAGELAVYTWDAARVQQWLTEDVGILEEAEPHLFKGTVDGKVLLMKYDDGLFTGVEFEDGQKGADMVKENLEGQCLSFFDVVASD